MNGKKKVNLLICLTNALSQPIMKKSAAVMEGRTVAEDTQPGIHSRR